MTTITTDQLTARGWTTKNIADHLDGNGPWTVDEIDAIERRFRSIGTAVKNRRTIVDRIDDDTMDHRDYVSRTILTKGRGWRPVEIETWLGDPDIAGDSWRRTPHRWHIDRVRAAEAADPVLGARAEHTIKERRAERIEKVIAAGDATWRKHGSEWLIQGRGLTEGAEVTVRKRNGEIKKVAVGEIVEHTDDGLTLARTARPARSTRKQSSRQADARRSGGATDKQIRFATKLLAQHARDYGVGPGDQLVLDSFYADFPTSDELRAMSRQEVSSLIDMLLHDAM